MKKALIAVLAISLALVTAMPAYASDWDVAGKVLTGIEGLRVVTGGKVDIIGSMTGINREKQATHYCSRRHIHVCQRVWVPHYVWVKKWVPEHREFDGHLGEIVVEGHYIRYKAEKGGTWHSDCDCR